MTSYWGRICMKLLAPTFSSIRSPTLFISSQISPGDDDDERGGVLNEGGGEPDDAEENVLDDDADPPSGAASTSGSDADYEIISHGDLNNGEKLTPS